MAEPRNNRFRVVCPHCGCRAQVRSSRMLSDTVGELNLLCTNDACGHRFVAHVAAVRTIAPSATPRPGVNLPTSHQAAFHQRRSVVPVASG